MHFDLSYNELQSPGCIEIAKLLPGREPNQGFRELKRLILVDNNIDDVGVEPLSKALTHTNCELNSLKLDRNHITAEGVKHLSTALKHINCKLKSLNLWHNKITDEGVEQLSTALTHANCKLNKLNLGSNRITQKGKELVKLMNIKCQVVFHDMELLPGKEQSGIFAD